MSSKMLQINSLVEKHNATLEEHRIFTVAEAVNAELNTQVKPIRLLQLDTQVLKVLATIKAYE